MKLFLGHGLKFFATALAILLLCESMYFYLGYYQDKVNGSEVYYALTKSKSQVNKKYRVLIIGDSVALQLYPATKDYDDIISLTCNAAISIAGFYFLMNNYFKTNPNFLPDEVIFLVNPFTLSNNLSVLSFHYFLKPFYNDEYYPEITPSLLDRIHEIPYYWLSQVPFVRSSSYCVNYSLDPPKWAWISPIANDYLRKSYELAESKNVKFKLIPSPIRLDRENEIMSAIQASINNKESDLLNLDIMQNYISMINFMDTSCFFDNIHFKTQDIPKAYLIQYDK